MDTASFFSRVLASKGLVCLAEFNPGKKPYQTFYEDQTVAAAAAVRLDSAGKTVYHACATFKLPESRKQENAAYMRAFWVDADVDAANQEKYPTLKDALTDIGRVCKELNLPLPLIVKSGNGAHAYWILDADIEAGQWGLAAARFKFALEHLQFRQDRTRTADAASVLRPVGTTWRKREPHRPVAGISAGSPISLERFELCLQAYADRVGANLGGYGGLRGDSGDGRRLRELWAVIGEDGISGQDLGTRTEYPPSSAGRITDFCQTLNHIANVRGNVGEPLWRGMLGLVKHTVEGNERCHEWSGGHPSYSRSETEEKINGWTQGPTTCAYFRGTDGNKCAGCPQTVSSPIHLGYAEDLVVRARPPFERVATEEVAAPLAWPKGYGWFGELSYYQKPDEANDQGRWMPFCDTLWYPVKRVRGEDGMWYLQVKHQAKNHTWREFDLPCELIGSQTGLTAALAAHEVFIYGKQGTMHAKDLLRQYTLDLQRQSIEQVTYTKLGWADEFRTFIMGNRRIAADSDVSILPGDFIRGAGWATDFGTAGSVEDWARLINVIYNRKGAEPYQFVIGCALAAPLVEIAEVDNWHGIPVAVTGRGGLGKTTTCKIASSIYGAANHFLVKSTKSGSTMNGMISKIGAARNLPLIFDEITERDPQEVSDFLYSLSDGKPKIRNRADGTIIDLGLSWKTVSFITSNKNVTELLARLENTVAEATQVRVFEIALTDDDIRIWSGMNAIDLIEHQLMQGNYGLAGREWIRYLIENRGVVREEVRKVRAKYNPNSTEETRERYYRDLIACVVVALKHAEKAGLLKFDIVGVAKWAKQNVLRLRVRRHEQQFAPEEYITHFLGSLHGRIIITKHFRDGRGAAETPLELLRGSPIARLALDDKIFVVSRKAIADWCAESRLQVSWLLDEMGKRDMIVYGKDDNGEAAVEHKERLGKGTNIPCVPSACVELRYESVIGTVK